MTNEQRAILAAWDRAVVVYREEPGVYTRRYEEAVMVYFCSVAHIGLDITPYYGPLAIAYGK